jgi:hypothetical protein
MQLQCIVGTPVSCRLVYILIIGVCHDISQSIEKCLIKKDPYSLSRFSDIIDVIYST